MNVPRCDQRAAVERWLERLPTVSEPEAWNAQFGSGTLFDAWTRSSVVQGVYEHNRALLARVVGTPGFRIIEVGGGDGRLWRDWLPADAIGELVIIDPVVESSAEVARALPSGVRPIVVHREVQNTLDDPLWADADAVVCSLTLHHVAGRDAADRAASGLSGPGKLEVLRTMGKALRSTGVLLLNEADVHCELDIPAGELLAERLMDSYIRRAGHSLLADVRDRVDADDDLRARWLAVFRHWCLEQIRLADVQVSERDVYELDVTRWLALCADAGLLVERCRPTDRYGLFYGYVLRSAPQ